MSGLKPTWFPAATNRLRASEETLFNHGAENSKHRGALMMQKNLPVSYRANSKALRLRDFFGDWILSLDKQFQRKSGNFFEEDT